jgi:peptide/nickel transport system permease protein
MMSLLKSTPKPVRMRLAIVLGILLLAVVVPLLPLADPVAMNVKERLTAPSWGAFLGNDEYGRDVLSRILWGARTSLAVAFIAAIVSAIAGTFLGLLGGYFRGIVELLTVRSSEVLLCLPPMLLALLVVTLLGAGTGTLILCLSILFTPGYVRVVYAETLSVRQLDFVSAQESIGTHPARILLRTILPNVTAPLIVQFSLTVAAAMVLESGLSFLGLGVIPPAPSWGLMIRGARGTMDQAPLMILWPCIALSLTIISLNSLCDALRDALDPKAHGNALSAHRPLAGRLGSRLLPGLFSSKQEKMVLSVRDLSLRVAAAPDAPDLVRGISLDIAAGETLALVGESGSGKTLTGLALLGLLPRGVECAAGSIHFTRRDGTITDLLTLDEARMQTIRGDEISMVFQDPGGSLDPVYRIGRQIAECIRAHRDVAQHTALSTATDLLKSVGLPDPERKAEAFPHELSGGQKQRAMIASAIANGPRLLIADEPTTALDVTIQAQIIELFADLKKRDPDMGMIFITHNLALVAQIADRICVMYAGEIVESGPVAEVFAAPKHPYTAALIASVPEGDNERLHAVPGTVPALKDFPSGCRFAPRCAIARTDCNEHPDLHEAGMERQSRCFHWKDVA